MSTPPRPQAVTSACLFVGISCALLLYYVVGWLTSWNTLDVQDGLRSALDGVDLGAIGLTTAGAIDALRTVLLVAVVPLVAGVVFAVYAARGHRQSRLLLTGIAALAALAFVATGGFIGLLPAAFAVAAVVQLWSRDSRIWFDVVNGREPSVAPRVAKTPAPTAARPDPFAPTAAPTADAPASIGPDPAHPHPASAPAVAPHDPTRLPASVRTIVLVTSIATGLALASSALFLLVYAVARDAVVDAQLDSPFRSMVDSTDAEIVEAMRVSAVISGITVVLGVAALVAMVLLARRKAVGHVALTVCAGVTIILGLFTLVGLPWAAAAVWVIVLLRRRESRTWAHLS